MLLEFVLVESSLNINSEHCQYFRSVFLPLAVGQIELTWIQNGKGKADPLQAWSGPQGSRKLRFPDFTTTAQDGGKFVSLTHRPPLLPGNAPDTHFC